MLAQNESVINALTRIIWALMTEKAPDNEIRMSTPQAKYGVLKFDKTLELLKLNISLKNFYPHKLNGSNFTNHLFFTLKTCHACPKT